MLKRLDQQIIKLFERGQEEEIGRRESKKDMGRLKEASAAPVLIEDDVPALEEVVEFGIAIIDAEIDNFANDEGYVSGGNWTYYASEEEIEMINAPVSSDSSDFFYTKILHRFLFLVLIRETPKALHNFFNC